MKKPILYLAGPEVFLPNMEEIRLAKLEICTLYNFIGNFPIDGDSLPDLQKRNLGYYICRKNKQKIITSNGVIANITPFKSISVDPGTAYEIGFADALKRPIFAYTNNMNTFAERNKTTYGCKMQGDYLVDNDNILIEDFDLVDNLMIDTSILDSSKTLITSKIPRKLDDLTLFEQAVSEARKYFNEDWLI